MTLIQLRALVAIVDAGLNMTLAAERVHVTQPGLSKQIRQLEQELGFAVFHRHGRSFERLTTEGEQVLTHARAMLEEARAIRELAQGLKRDNGGSLVIGASHASARYTLPPVLAALRRRLPTLRLAVVPAERDEALAALAEGQLDAAMVSTGDDSAPAERALPVLRWRRVGLLPRSHPLATQAHPALAELARIPLIAHGSALKSGASLPRCFAEAGFSPTIGGSTHDADAIKAWVRAGLGLGVLAEMALTPEDRDLAVLELDHLLPDCTTWLVLREDRAASAPVELLVTQLLPGLDLTELRRWLAGHAPPPRIAADAVPRHQRRREAPALPPGVLPRSR
jgi:DNA-binding transcriptional LysR family regulator